MYIEAGKVNPKDHQLIQGTVGELKYRCVFVCCVLFVLVYLVVVCCLYLGMYVQCCNGVIITDLDNPLTQRIILDLTRFDPLNDQTALTVQSMHLMLQLYMY